MAGAQTPLEVNQLILTNLSSNCKKTSQFKRFVWMTVDTSHNENSKNQKGDTMRYGRLTYTQKLTRWPA